SRRRHRSRACAPQSVLPSVGGSRSIRRSASAAGSLSSLPRRLPDNCLCCFMLMVGDIMVMPLRVNEFALPQDATCLIEADEYVPLRFRTFERPLGSSYLRLGDLGRSLAELLVDPTTDLLRGITITSFNRLTRWPSVDISQATSTGLPIFDIIWKDANR